MMGTFSSVIEVAADKIRNEFINRKAFDEFDARPWRKKSIYSPCQNGDVTISRRSCYYCILIANVIAPSSSASVVVAHVLSRTNLDQSIKRSDCS